MTSDKWLDLILDSLKTTVWDIAPIIIVLGFFQFVVLKRKIPQFKRILIGLVLVVMGLSIFIIGLEKGIFPLGMQMAEQLANPNFLASGDGELTTKINNGELRDPLLYIWIIIFAFLVGFSTALAEPALIAVALKAKEISTGAISFWGLRIAVAIGGAMGMALGAYRIVVGTPLEYYIISGYIFLLVQTYFAPRFIIPLAYDTGGVTTSTVTVPMGIALGIGLASNVPGRSPLLDGFGLIAFAALFPIITVLAYAMITERLTQKKKTEEVS